MPLRGRDQRRQNRWPVSRMLASQAAERSGRGGRRGALANDRGGRGGRGSSRGGRGRAQSGGEKCFKCGSPSHMAPDCKFEGECTHWDTRRSFVTKNKQPAARVVFAEEEDDNDVSIRFLSVFDDTADLLDTQATPPPPLLHRPPLAYNGLFTSAIIGSRKLWSGSRIIPTVLRGVHPCLEGL